MLSRLLLALAATAALASSSGAHETLPKSWCEAPGATPRIIAAFTLDSRDLHWLALNYGTPNHCLIGACASCGGVDEWHPARAIAQAYCEQFDPKNQGPENVQAFIDTPDFNSPTHHTDYKFSDELSFQCVVCE